MAFCPECNKDYGEDVKICPKDGSILSLPAEKKDALIGRVIDGKYKITEKIGDGGMGSVFKAEHLLMGRIVAIKVLRRYLAGDAEGEEFVRRFQAEARTACKIHHPHAITIHDFGLDGERPYLVMEFNEGRSLKTILSESGPLPLPRIVSIMSQVCEAIDEAHSHGIVHRDLKPDNIMISKRRDGSDFAVVLDFGVAKILSGGAKDSHLTKTGAVIGTPRYMPPEQAISEQIDVRSDIYSLGIILYEMLTGDVPFNADSALQLMMKHVNDAPLPLREFKPDLDIPEAIEAVVARAIAKDPAARPQNMLQFLEELKQAAGLGSSSHHEDAEVSVSASGPRPQVPPSTRKEAGGRKRRSAPLVAAGALVLCLGGGTALILSRASTSSTSAAAHLPAQSSAPLLEQSPVLPSGHSPALPSDEEKTGLPAPGGPPALQASSAPEASLIERGTADITAGNYLQAVSLLEQALQAAPNNPAAYKKLAATYAKLGRDEEALNYYQQAISKDPADAKTKVLCGFTLKRLGRLDEARREFASALELDSGLSVAKAQLEELDLASTPSTESTSTLADLISNLANEDREKRKEAAQELEARGLAAAAPLIEALSSPDHRVRYWAAEILGRLKAEEAVEPLMRTINDKNRLVAEGAIEALKKIGVAKGVEAAYTAEAKRRAERAKEIAAKQAESEQAAKTEPAQEEKSGLQGFFENFWRRPK